LAIEAVPPLYFVQGEITSIDLETIIALCPVFDVVLSDLAPKTTGMRQVDQQRSLELASLAWEWAQRLLKEGGHFLVKIFEGPDTPILSAVLKQNFSVCRPIKPAGSRPASREIYLLGLKKRGATAGSRAPKSGP
jgi:23S rRNA (uridine2552-2'-O)-methyltransferase